MLLVTEKTLSQDDLLLNTVERPKIKHIGQEKMIGNFSSYRMENLGKFGFHYIEPQDQRS